MRKYVAGEFQPKSAEEFVKIVGQGGKASAGTRIQRG
jgi:hypothetical protein